LQPFSLELLFLLLALKRQLFLAGAAFLGAGLAFFTGFAAFLGAGFFVAITVVIFL